MKETRIQRTANELAAHIMNCIDTTDCKAVVYANLYWLILAALARVGNEAFENHTTPSDN